MSTILIASSVAALIVVPIVWYLVNRNKEVKEPTDAPTYTEPIGGNVQESQEPAEEPTQTTEQQQEPIEKCTEQPIDEPEYSEEEPAEPTADDKLKEFFYKLIDYFCIPRDSKTSSYLWNIFLRAETNRDLFDKNNFPIIIDYWGDKEHENSAEVFCAWLFAMVLTEILPEQRQQLYKAAYNYCSKGKDEPMYGWDFLSDPNVLRQTASILYAITRTPEAIPALRAELQSKEIKYKDKIDELFLDLKDFMPAAPGPYIPSYSARYDKPVDAKNTEKIDKKIHEYISQYYNLDTKDAEKRQATIQAIADKEAHLQHLFGKPRTVYTPTRGYMTFNPVFGKHNIGIEIPDNGAIAKLCEAVGKPCSNNRKSLLEANYGRRRPGQGEYDATPNAIPEQRALVNYAIEEGDGHTTGYYDQNGDYVDSNGTHIGDYGTYFQSQLYANSYPSGHSAYIWGIAVILAEVMPDKAVEIMKAANQFAINRTVARYHWTSDTIMGRVIGSTMVPILHATSNINLEKLLDKAKEEYEKLCKGIPVDPEPEQKVNTSLSYVVGGYGSCHVDAGEKQLCHCCNKECYKDRTPAITVNQRVNFTIEGDGVTTYEGATSGVWEANTLYYLICPAVAEGEEKIATITMRNENGVRVLKYKLSRQGTHDDGPEQ